MVGPIVLAASAGIGMLAGLATADRCASGNNLPLMGSRPPTAGCATCGGTGKVACLALSTGARLLQLAPHGVERT